MGKKVSGAGVPAKVESYAILAQNSAAIQEVMAANLGRSGIAPLSLDRVAIPAGGGTTWQVPTLEGETPMQEIVGVIVHWQDVRVYFPGEYTGEKAPPACSSEDGVTGSGEPGGVCADCPLAAFGSGKGGKAQACKQVRRLFVCQQADLLPLLVALPPTSLGSCRKHFQRLASRAVPFYGVVSKLSLKRAQNAGGIAYSQVELGVVEVLGEAERAAWKKLNAMFAPLLSRLSAETDDYQTHDAPDGE